MKYRKLGSSELIVSEIAFGSWLTFSDAQRKDAAIACVHRALDRGVILIDKQCEPARRGTSAFPSGPSIGWRLHSRFPTWPDSSRASRNIRCCTVIRNGPCCPCAPASGQVLAPELIAQAERLIDQAA